MLLAFTLLAASMTHLGDLADVVKADTMPSTRDFCVTGTVSYVLVFQDKLCHVLLEDGGIGVDVLGSFRSAPVPEAGDIVRLDGMIVHAGAGSVLPKFSTLEIIGRGVAPHPLESHATEVMGGRFDFHRAQRQPRLRFPSASSDAPPYPPDGQICILSPRVITDAALCS